MNYTNGGTNSAYTHENRKLSVEPNKSGQQFFNRRYMFSQLSPSSTQEQLPKTTNNFNNQNFQAQVQSEGEETFFLASSFEQVPQH